MPYLLRHMVATARSFPQMPTTTQVTPAAKNTKIGINAPICAVKIAATVEIQDRTKNKPPTAIKIVRCDFTYLNSSSPDSR